MNIYLILTISLFYLKGSYSQLDIEMKHVDLSEWDYLMFSQRWPITACMEWEGKNKTYVCNLPKNPHEWIVHGLWPTKTGTNGPNDCNSAIHFDPQQLESILDDLNDYWTNIEKGTKMYSFWSHEWDKHGTCASLLPQLNSVYNYFKKGLQLNKEYDITSILSEANIVPSTDNYTLDQISNAIEKKLSKTPQIQCVVNSKSKESLISELRLCFDKSFELIDCSSVGLELSNCSKKKPIKYISDVLGEMATATVDGYYIDPQEIISKEAMLHEWYILIKFFIWFTL